MFSLESFKCSECGERLHQLEEPFISLVNKINVLRASMKKLSTSIQSVGELGLNRKRQYRDKCSAREGAWYHRTPRCPVSTSLGAVSLHVSEKASWRAELTLRCEEGVAREAGGLRGRGWKTA